MRDEIIAMCLARLGDPPPTLDAVLADDDLARALCGLLRDRPPLLVIRQLLAEIEAGRRARGFDPAS